MPTKEAPSSRSTTCSLAAYQGTSTPPSPNSHTRITHGAQIKIPASRRQACNPTPPSPRASLSHPPHSLFVSSTTSPASSVVITGPSGAGKTSLLRHLATTASEVAPILIQARELSRYAAAMHVQTHKGSPLHPLSSCLQAHPLLHAIYIHILYVEGGFIQLYALVAESLQPPHTCRG